VGKLINPARQAQAREAKVQRMAAIEAAALAEFQVAAYAEVTLDGIGLKAGVPAGTASLYFGSREALFVRVVAAQVKAWCAAVLGLLEREGRLDGSATAALLARSFSPFPALPRLLYLLPFALEHARDDAGLTMMIAGVRKPLAELARRLEAQSPAAAARGGAALLGDVVSLAAAVHPRATPRGGLALALTDPGLARFRVDFEVALERLLAQSLAPYDEG
jgi:AcrR family transcriptional regulator